MGAPTQQIITTSTVGEADGSFVVKGVFWLQANAANIAASPHFQSVVPGISAGDLAILRSGAYVEQSFSSDAPVSAGGQANGLPFPPNTAQSTVDTALQEQYAAVQAALAAQAPPLTTSTLRAYSGSAWAAFTGTPGALSIGIPPQITTELYQAIALGLVPNVIQGRAAGYVANATATNTKIRATAYAPAAPGVAAQRSISSSSASDAAAGTGARTVLITYLTTAFVLETTTVTLNGTTPVNLAVSDLAYVESMQVASCGSNLTNVGIISLFNSTAGGGGTLGSIASNDSQTFWAHHYVPAGKTCLVINVSGGGKLAAGIITINRTGDPSQSTLPTIGIGGLYPHLAGGNEDHIFQVPIVVPGPDLIVLSEQPNTATASNFAYGTFEYVQL